MIMHIHKSASYAVTVRQLTYNIKLQETQGHKLKWSSVLREMCNIAWFIVKYNMICQYLAYLKKQLIQNGSILKVISNEVENNMYIRKMKTEFTAITNIIVIIAIIIFSSAITGNTIIRTIGLHGIKMHHVLTTYFIFKSIYFYSIKHYCFLKSEHTVPHILPQAFANNTTKEPISELSPSAVHYSVFTLPQVNSSLIATQIQYTASYKLKQREQSNTTENHKSSSSGVSYYPTKQLCSSSSAQIPSYYKTSHL